ncbi:uncharacterized protein N7484_002624 [Penicillium longicatenatum]|uniref:uncharacterized protein n=1 Tax=Penicillium longicatenatum TaxID=1561947 RepID=UPI0025477B97|nr:uncharacterized protein N7484_002624 [Penicillium longicatenatum]KAJ5648901.1 hypothetical protein N7484_002624 [Penicillium longicatenatum]
MSSSGCALRRLQRLRKKNVNAAMMRRPTIVIGSAIASFMLVELQLFEELVSAVSVGDSVGILWVVLVVVSEKEEDNDDDDDVFISVDDDEVDVKAVVVVDEVDVTVGVILSDSGSEELVRITPESNHASESRLTSLDYLDDMLHGILDGR